MCQRHVSGGWFVGQPAGSHNQIIQIGVAQELFGGRLGPQVMGEHVVVLRWLICAHGTDL